MKLVSFQLITALSGEHMVYKLKENKGRVIITFDLKHVKEII